MSNRAQPFVAALWLATLPATSLAGTDFIPNGTFDEVPSDGWDKSGGTTRIVVEGTQFATGPYDVTGITFPSSPNALMLVFDPSTSIQHIGYPVTITREEFSLDTSGPPGTEVQGVFIARVENEDLLGVAEAPVGPQWKTITRHLATGSGDPYCSGKLQLTLFTQLHLDPDPEYVLYDNARFTGPVCPDFIDEDRDGWCLRGVDLDGDGDCARHDEVLELGPGDCDNNDPDRFPTNPELAADLVDQDCDDLDGEGPRSVTGTVWLGEGLAATGSGVEGAVITLWLDGGDGLADGYDDRVFERAFTEFDGSYAFDGLSDVRSYWLSVDSRTIGAPELHLDADPEALWGEQVWGPEGARCDDGAGGERVLTAAGPCVGGRVAGTSDGRGLLRNAQHIAWADTVGGDVVADFGFAHDVATHVGDERSEGAGARFAQGSLRQALVNANATLGPDSVQFTPVAGPIDTWWLLELTEPLPPLTDPGTTLDGTAWCDGVACPLGDLRDVGLAPLDRDWVYSVGPDGVPDTDDELTVRPFDAPTLEIVGDGTPWAITGTLGRIALQRIPIEVAGAGTTVHDVVIGLHPDGSAPPLATTGPGVVLADDAAEVTLQHILMAVDGTAVQAGRPGGTIVEDCVLVPPAGGPSDLWTALEWATPDAPREASDLVTRTHVAGFHGSCASVAGDGSVALTLREVACLDGGDGVVVDAAADVLLDQLYSASNLGDGVRVSSDAAAVDVQAGSFADHGGLAVELAGAPGVSPNDGVPVGPNGGLDYPIIELTELRDDGSVEVVGGVGLPGLPYARHPDVDLYLARADGGDLGEVVLGDGQAVGHGEPFAWLGACPTATDGSFACQLGAGLLEGDLLVGLARLDGRVSEAGPNHSIADLGPDDTDLDGVSDQDEALLGTDPTLADTDGDGLDDGEELDLGTDPLLSDTDGDGVDDGAEVAKGTDPVTAPPIVPTGDTGHTAHTATDTATTGQVTADTASPPSTTVPDDSTPTADTASTTPEPTTVPSTTPPDAKADDADAGCGCQAQPTSGAWLALVGALALGRRRPSHTR